MEKIVEVLAWPLVVLIIGLVAIFVFRGQIAALIGRTRKVGEGGLETFEAQHAIASGKRFFGVVLTDTATRTMVLVTHQGVTEAAPRPTVSGVYRDRWRKTHTGWRFAHQAAYVDRDPGFST